MSMNDPGSESQTEMRRGNQPVIERVANRTSLLHREVRFLPSTIAGSELPEPGPMPLCGLVI